MEYGRKIQMTRSVPQGSVLGSTLWNAMYHELLDFEMRYNAFDRIC